MAKILGRDAILQVDDRPVQEVEVPEWSLDGDRVVVLIRKMDGLTWVKLVAVLKGEDDDSRIRAQTCAACLVDEKGELLFEPGNEDDINLLLGRSHDALLRVSNAAILMSRATGRDQEAYRQNFPGTAEDGLPSA